MAFSHERGEEGRHDGRANGHRSWLGGSSAGNRKKWETPGAGSGPRLVREWLPRAGLKWLYSGPHGGNEKKKTNRNGWAARDFGPSKRIEKFSKFWFTDLESIQIILNIFNQTLNWIQNRINSNKLFWNFSNLEF
jgi:hypothetical protein